MKTLNCLIKRNMKLYFKDKGMILVSLITPLILLLLYATFLGKVFKEGFLTSLPENVTVGKRLIDGFVGGQLLSSVLATCTITITFCSNLVMIQDKFTGAIKDITISPVKKTTLSLSYFIAAFLASLTICYITMIIGFIYLSIVGWYLTLLDVLNIITDILLLVLFGTAISSVIHLFLNTQGQASAVGTIVSSLYGFICGAYMPMSQFSYGLKNTLSLLPGTYGTVLLRNHCMQSVINKLGFPPEVIKNIRDSVDCNIYNFGKSISTGWMYLILCLSIVGFISIFILLNYIKLKKSKNK